MFESKKVHNICNFFLPVFDEDDGSEGNGSCSMFPVHSLHYFSFPPNYFQQLILHKLSTSFPSGSTVTQTTEQINFKYNKHNAHLIKKK